MRRSPTLRSWLLAPVLLLSLSACEPTGGYPATVDGWAPVYATDSVMKVEGATARSIEDGGKIYIKDNRLYQVENGKGIHIIDISNPASPKKLKFIRCYGALELSIMDDYLYSNNVNDLVVVSISDMNNIHEVRRKASQLNLVATTPPGDGYFECPDPAKGTIIGWEQKLIHNPRCRR